MQLHPIRVLVLFQFSNQNHLIDSLCSNLAEQGIQADSLNIVNFRFISQFSKKRPVLIKILAPLMGIPKLRTVLNAIFYKKIIINLSKKYDIIDIQFFSAMYDNIIPKLKADGRKVIITIWGSDFARSDNERREKQRNLFHKIDCIHIGTKQLKSQFLSYFKDFENKIRIAHFGLVQLDKIKKIAETYNSNEIRSELKLPYNKLIIACGANGIEAHQHLLILDSIEKLPNYLKDRIFIIVPFTYGGKNKYLNKIKDRLQTLDISHKIFDKRLSDEFLSKLRLSTDIAITIQKVDAFSGALQEHLYAENIVIAGDWLPYDILNQNGINYIPTSLSDLSEKLYDVLLNCEKYKIAFADNKRKMYELSSWKHTISSWVEIYNNI
jgi:hypothetical protein